MHVPYSSRGRTKTLNIRVKKSSEFVTKDLRMRQPLDLAALEIFRQ